MEERRARLSGKGNESHGRDNPAPLDRTRYERRPRLIATEPDPIHDDWSIGRIIRDLSAGSAGTIILTGPAMLVCLGLEKASQFINLP